jgi:hypothetical protein
MVIFTKQKFLTLTIENPPKSPNFWILNFEIFFLAKFKGPRMMYVVIESDLVIRVGRMLQSGPTFWKHAPTMGPYPCV